MNKDEMIKSDRHKLMDLLSKLKTGELCTPNCYGCCGDNELSFAYCSDIAANFEKELAELGYHKIGDDELIKGLEATNKRLKQEVKSLESALDLLLKRYEELGIEIRRQPSVEPSWNEPITHVVDYITIPQQRLAIPRR